MIGFMIGFIKTIITICLFIAFVTILCEWGAQSDKNWDESQKVECQAKGGVFMLDMSKKHHNLCQL